MTIRNVLGFAAVASALGLLLSTQRAAGTPASDSQAQALAAIGRHDLQLGRLADAQSNCDAALKLDPANLAAKDCLDRAASLLVDQDLTGAEAKLLSGDKPGAIALASKWVGAGASPDQRRRAWNILHKSQSTAWHSLWFFLFPQWLRDWLGVMVDLIALGVLLLLARKSVRAWQRSKQLRSRWKTNWNMIPLNELPAPANGQTGISTDAVLDALARLGHELARDLWQPKLLLLRPTPPVNYEPAIISEFLSEAAELIVLAPGAKDLCDEWKLHDVQLDEAVQKLQFKMAAGIDVGSVARFLHSIYDWLNAGAPTISGVVEWTGEKENEKSVSIHIAARHGPLQSIAVSAATGFAPGIDPIELSAERAALKFLLRTRYPGMTNDEVDGYASLRQGATQFAQYAGTVPGAGTQALTRTSTLAKAAYNFGFFRASIPLHSTHIATHGQAGRSKRGEAANDQDASIWITDNIRQAALLAEGVAHALVGTDEELTEAIDCFRQLQDWPGMPETGALRLQAAYNEAVVWRQAGNYGRCVLMLTELLGEKAPDTIVHGREGTPAVKRRRPDLPISIRFPVRLARLSAFAQYSREDWRTLPKERAKLLIDDAERLIGDLDHLRAREDHSPHDRRMADYMYFETLRAIGHVELLRVVTGPAARLYQNNRPTGLKNASINNDGRDRLERAIAWMLTCEEHSPNCELYCDLAEAYLLLKDFGAAEGFARHAILQSGPTSASKSDFTFERACYLAAEASYLHNTDASLALARRYAMSYTGAVTLEEFKAVRIDLGLAEEAPAEATAAMTNGAAAGAAPAAAIGETAPPTAPPATP